MSYKSILTYTDSDGKPGSHVSVAMELARRFDAHLTIAALGCDPDVPPSAFGDFPGVEMAEIFEQSRERAEEMARKAGELLERESVKGEGRPLVSTYSALPRAFGRLARFSDLVVLGQPSGPTEPHEAMNLIEGTLFDGDAAALVCPEKVLNIFPESIVIGWNGGREALQAVRRAMPLLREAKSVEVAMIEPSELEGEPGAELALFLARHGVAVEITTRPQEGHRVSEILRQRVVDRNADLLVMGAYGHSRFREYVLGGATRDVLLEAAVPVLMAH